MKTKVEIESEWDNIFDVFPVEMYDFQSYLNSRDGISWAWADINGLKNPEVDLSLGFTYTIDYNGINGWIEVTFFNQNIISSRLIKRNGDLYDLSEYDLDEIMKECRKTKDPFVHSMLDHVTLRFIHELLEK